MSLTTRVDARPQPTAEQNIHTRGGKSLDATVAGTWQMTYVSNTVRTFSLRQEGNALT